MIPKISGNRFLLKNWNSGFCINFYDSYESKEFIKSQIIGWCDSSKVFARVRNDDERKVRYIRTRVQSLTFPCDPNKFVPFGPNWIVKGYIVEKENKKYFDFVDLLTINGYN